jgi:predicted RNase H-like HicB family nuclease
MVVFALIIKMEKHRQLTGIIKKAGNYYVALCLELNVSSQGESIEEAKRMLQEACEEYLSYIKEEKLEDEIRAVPLEVLREFLVEDVEYVRPSRDWIYSENISFEVEAGA